MSNAGESYPPPAIYLQWHGDASPEEFDGQPLVSEVTWSEDRLFEHDVRYVRADMSADLEAEMQEAWKIIDVLYMDALDNHGESWPRAREWQERNHRFYTRPAHDNDNG